MNKKGIAYEELDLENGEEIISGKPSVEFRGFDVVDENTESLKSIHGDNGCNDDDDEAEELQDSDAKIDNEGENDTESKRSHHAVLQVFVPNEHREFYEKKWLQQIFRKLSNFKGFRFVEIGSSDGDSTEYVVVLIFDTYDNFKEWEISSERKGLLAELRKRNIVSTTVNAYGGSISNTTREQFTEDTNRISLHNRVAQVPKALPPPKWKLAILIFIAVYCALIVIGFSGTANVMLRAGMPLSLVLFVSISHSVILLSYAGLPLLMSIPFIDKWLRSKRRCEPSKMHPLHAVMDQGLQIFSVKSNSRDVPCIIRERIDKLEKRVEKLLSMNSKLQHELSRLVPENLQRDSIGNNHHIDGKIPEYEFMRMANHITTQCKEKSNGAQDRSGPLTMAVRHYVKWEFQYDFESWTKKMDAEMSKFEGYEGMISIAPKNDGDPYINSFTFSSFEDLMRFSKSDNRKKILSELTHMLEADSAYLVAEERCFSDAFTELMVPTGGTAKVPHQLLFIACVAFNILQSRPPPIWKSVILTIIPLHVRCFLCLSLSDVYFQIIVWQCGNGIGPFITRQYSLSPYLLLLVTTAINVIVNTYIGLPLMLSQFGDWLHMPRQMRECSSLLNVLDVGLSTANKVLFLIIYIGVNVAFGFGAWGKAFSS